MVDGLLNTWVDGTLARTTVLHRGSSSAQELETEEVAKQLDTPVAGTNNFVIAKKTPAIFLEGDFSDIPVQSPGNTSFGTFDSMLARDIMQGSTPCNTTQETAPEPECITADKVVAHIKKNFERLILNAVSVDVRSAILTNRKFTRDEGVLFAEARRSIENFVCKAVHSVWTGKGIPPVGLFREIVTSILIDRYPNLYEDQTTQITTERGQVLEMEVFRGFNAGGKMKDLPANMRCTYKRKHSLMVQKTMSAKRSKSTQLTVKKMLKGEYGVIYERLNSDKTLTSDMLRNVQNMAGCDQANWLRSNPEYLQDFLRNRSPSEWKEMPLLITGQTPYLLISQTEWLTGADITANVTEAMKVEKGE